MIECHENKNNTKTKKTKKQHLTKVKKSNKIKISADVLSQCS